MMKIRFVVATFLAVAVALWAAPAQAGQHHNGGGRGERHHDNVRVHIDLRSDGRYYGEYGYYGMPMQALVAQQAAYDLLWQMEQQRRINQAAYQTPGQVIMEEQLANIRRLQRENHSSADDSNDRPAAARQKQTPQATNQPASQIIVYNLTNCTAQVGDAKVGPNGKTLVTDITTTKVAVESTACQATYKTLEPGHYALVCK